MNGAGRQAASALPGLHTGRAATRHVLVHAGCSGQAFSAICTRDLVSFF